MEGENRHFLFLWSTGIASYTPSISEVRYLFSVPQGPDNMIFNANLNIVMTTGKCFLTVYVHIGN